VPPEAVIVWLYGKLTVPPGNVPGAIVMVGPAIVSERFAVVFVNGAAGPLELSVAFTWNVKVPAAVAVPLSVPLAAKVSPAGRAPDAMA
jgi:hypothetical protein